MNRSLSMRLIVLIITTAPFFDKITKIRAHQKSNLELKAKKFRKKFEKVCENFEAYRPTPIFELGFQTT